MKINEIKSWLPQVVYLVLFVLFSGLFIQQSIVLLTPYSSFYHSSGMIEKQGEYRAEKINKNRSLSYPVKYIKFWHNDTIYAYKNNSFLLQPIDENKPLTVYHKGMDDKQSVVDIVQIIQNNEKIFRRYHHKSSDIFLVVFYAMGVIAASVLGYRRWAKKKKQTQEDLLC